MSKITELIEKIRNPGREFTPIPFWFLNDAFTDEEIVRQLEDFNDKGVHGVILHPRIGIPAELEYLSDEYMHYMGTAIKTAARLDMKVVLYDEAMYPSGSAHGKVVQENPDFAAQGIFLCNDANEGRLITTTKSGKYIMQLPTGGTIRGVHWGEDDWEENAPKAADLLSIESVSTFIRLTHERYYALFGEYFGNTIIGFFTDEPDVRGRCAKPGCFAWTRGFEDVIVANGGELPELEGLFTGESNKTVELYKKLIFERECDVYYKSLADWCVSHNIDLMGHPHKGDDIECESYFGIPGQDLVFRHVAPETGGLTGQESAQGKCSSDAARIFGRRRNSNECYGACYRDNITWYLTCDDLKWFTDWLGVRGVNMFIPHAFYYSVRGRRKDERPPDVGPNNIWWKYFDTVSTYIKRISYIMTDSHNTAKVCVMCENRNMPTDEIAWMYQNQIEFNYLPYNFVPENAYRDGKLYVGDNTYEYVCNDWKNSFPDMKRADCIDDITLREIYTADKCEGLRVSCIVKDGIKMWFLVNEGEADISTDAYVAGEGCVIKMDLWSGEVKCAATRNVDNKVHFKLALNRRESVLIMLGQEDYPTEREKKYAEISFKLISEDKLVKTYSGEYSGIQDDLYICVSAEEMVECFVNGSFCGFSLWNRHEFCISPHLTDGINTVELKVTGSAANKFTDSTIEYGLMI